MIWRDAHGVRWRARVPRTTSAVLDALAFRALDYNAHALAGQVPSGDALSQITEWLVAHTVALEGLEDEGGAIEWAKLTEPERFDVMDCVLTAGEQLAYFDVILGKASLSSEVLAQVRAYLDLLLDGGCGCPTCKDGKPMSPRWQDQCLTIRHPEHVRHLVALWSPVRDEPVLDQPYWLHQVKATWLAAVGARRREAELAEQARQQTKAERDRLSSKYGLW